LILARSRMFVEKYQEGIDYLDQALVKYHDSAKIKDLRAKLVDEQKKEDERIQ
jgi:hypothetical protein